jgi:hypothetical protein
MADRALVATAHALALDRTAAQVVAALRAAGIDALVLKGPILARWLYADGTPRPYDDVDLLVAPRHLGAAYRVVERIGADPVDLDDALNGAGLEPACAWRLLRERAVVEHVAGQGVLALDPVARAVHVALHAWWHGPAAPKPLEDLRRALGLLPEDGWREAALLADRLRAATGFDGGLALDPAGRELLERLGRPVPRERRATPLAEADPGVRRLAELRLRHGVRARLHLLRRVIVPVPGEMRAHYPGARRGRAQLAAAYALRSGRALAALPGVVLRSRGSA